MKNNQARIEHKFEPAIVSQHSVLPNEPFGDGHDAQQGKVAIAHLI